MSDEIHIESAYRAYDETLRKPWHGMSPDEELMAREEAEEDEAAAEAAEAAAATKKGGWLALAEVQQKFLVFCFADTRPEEWQTVAARAYVVISFLFNTAFARRSMAEISDYRQTARPVSGFPAVDVMAALRGQREMFGKVLAYYFPDGKAWLKNGTQNLYLIARNYQPGLVTRWNEEELTYERLAGVFGEIPLAPAAVRTEEMSAEAWKKAQREAREWVPEGWCPEGWKKAQERARSRWSARAQQLIVRPIERMSGNAPALFGKGCEVRKKYQAAAMGNQNRRTK